MLSNVLHQGREATEQFCKFAVAALGNDLQEQMRVKQMLSLLPAVQWDSPVDAEFTRWDASDPFSTLRELIPSDTQGRYAIDAPQIAQRFAIAAVHQAQLIDVLTKGVELGVFTAGVDPTYGIDVEGRPVGLLERLVLRSARNDYQCQRVRDALQMTAADLMQVIDRVERRLIRTAVPSDASARYVNAWMVGAEELSMVAKLGCKLASLSMPGAVPRKAVWQPLFDSVSFGESKRNPMMRSLLEMTAKFENKARCSLEPPVMQALIDEGYGTGGLLHRAAVAMSCETAAILLANGSDPRYRGAFGATPLEVVKDLFPEGFDPVGTQEAKTRSQMIALLSSAEARCEAMDAVHGSRGRCVP